MRESTSEEYRKDADQIAIIAERFEQFIRENFEVEDDDDFFSPSINLWEEGYVDSVGVVEIITFLEETYAIEIPKPMLFDPAFTSVSGIAERIASLL